MKLWSQICHAKGTGLSSLAVQKYKTDFYQQDDSDV